jgi:parallel beta-helix repeat protein
VKTLIALPIFFFFLFLSLSIAKAQEYNISNCSVLNETGATYYLTQDIIDSNVSTCIDITANNITLDCQGHMIDGTDVDISKGVYINNNYVTIKNCLLSDWYDSIYVYSPYSPYAVIKNTTISSSTDKGIFLTSYNNTIINVTFSNNYAGLGIYNHNNTVENSSFSGNSYGIYIQSGKYNTIKNNRIDSSGIRGIYLALSDSDDNYIYNNLFNNVNNFGIESGSISYWNTTYQIGTNIWNSSLGYIGGNLWTNPANNGYSDTCVDADYNGFCDNPYTLATNNTDYLPIAKTVGQGAPQEYNISNCSELNETGATYYLTQDITNSSAWSCMNITASNITLDCQGHLIEGSNQEWVGGNEVPAYTGIMIPDGSDYVVVKNCVLTNWTMGAIWFRGSQTHILNNTMRANLIGVHQYNGTGYNVIENNTVEESSWVAVWNHIGYYNTYLNNIIINNNATGLHCTNDNNNVFDSNIVINNTIGISFYQSGDNNATNNFISSNDEGIRIYRSSGEIIWNNIIENSSDYGIRLWGDGQLFPANNKIYNNLLNNTNNFWTDSSEMNYFNTTKQSGTRIYSNGTEIGGNYWTNSTGNDYSDTCTDSDTDGFCDDPLVLTTNNTDYLPLSNQYTLVTCVIPYENMEITNDTTFCRGTYYLNFTTIENSIRFSNPNVKVYCNETVFIGNNTPDSTAIMVDRDNVTITKTDDASFGCKFSNYRHGIDVNPIANSVVEYVDIENIQENGEAGIFVSGGTNFTIRHIRGYDSKETVDVRGNNNYGTVDDVFCHNMTGWGCVAAGFSPPQNLTLNLGNVTGDNGNVVSIPWAESLDLNCFGLINGSKGDDTNGIYVKESLGNLTIKNCTIKDSHNGILAQNSTDILIEKNELTGNAYSGISFEGGGNSTITNNKLSDGFFGILVWYWYFDENAFMPFNVTVSYNEVHDCSFGGIYVGGNFSSAADNTVYNSARGITFGGSTDSPPEEWEHDYQVIKNNIIIGSSTRGLAVYLTRYGLVENNTVQDSNNGFELGGSLPGWYSQAIEMTVKDNKILNNSVGISIGNYSENNTIYNNLLNNTQNFIFGGTIYQNYWNTSYQSGANIWNSSLGYIGGNFWTNPNGNEYSDTCWDTNADGFCDDPYTLAENNTDYLPIAKTVGQVAPTCVEPYENMVINSDTILCQGSYYLNDSDRNGAIQVSGSNFVVTCNNTEIYGDYNTNWDGGTGFKIDTAKNVTIEGCYLHEYAHPIETQNTEDLILKSLNISHWGTRGIWGVNNTRAVVRDSYFSNHFDTPDAAIDFSGGEEDGVYPCEKINSFISVYNNSFKHARRGVRYAECVFNSTIYNNSFENISLTIGTDLGMYKIYNETLNITIRDNFMYIYYRPSFDSVSVGIRAGSNGTIVLNNTLIGQSIYLTEGNYSVVRYNNITNVSHAILPYFTSNDEISFNYMDTGDGAAIIYRGADNIKTFNNTIISNYLTDYRINEISTNILSCNNSVTYNYSFHISSGYFPKLVNVMRTESDSCTPYISYTAPIQISFGSVIPYNTYVNDTEKTTISSNMVNMTFSLNGTSDFVSNGYNFSISYLNFSADKNFPYPVEETTVELNTIKNTFLFLVNQTNSIIYNLWRLKVPKTYAGDYTANVTLMVST